MAEGVCRQETVFGIVDEVTVSEPGGKGGLKSGEPGRVGMEDEEVAGGESALPEFGNFVGGAEVDILQRGAGDDFRRASGFGGFPELFPGGQVEAFGIDFRVFTTTGVEEAGGEVQDAAGVAVGSVKTGGASPHLDAAGEP